MGEVRKLELAPRQVNESALQLAEQTLARIKSGEVTSIAIVEVRVAGDVAHSWSKTDQYHALNSGAARLAVAIASSPSLHG